MSVVSPDFVYIVEKVHSHTGEYAFEAAVPEGTYTLSGLTTFTGDTPQEDRYAPTLFTQTFRVGNAAAPADTADLTDVSTNTGGTDTTADTDMEDAGTNEVPTPSLLAALAVVGLAGIALHWRRKGQS